MKYACDRKIFQNNTLIRVSEMVCVYNLSVLKKRIVLGISKSNSNFKVEVRSLIIIAKLENIIDPFL